MDIGWFRDLVICISGLVLAGVLIFISVLSYSLYRRRMAVLKSIGAISTTIQEISSRVGEELLKPTIQMVAIIQGVRQGIDAIGKFFKKE